MLSYIRYITAGSLAVLANYLILILLVRWGHADPLLSSAISFMGGMTLNYNLQYYWTFRSKATHRSALPKFAVIAIATLFLSALIFWFLTDVIHLWYIYSQTVAIILISIINYFLSRKLVF